jgi:hypothetical protein
MPPDFSDAGARRARAAYCVVTAVLLGGLGILLSAVSGQETLHSPQPVTSGDDLSSRPEIVQEAVNAAHARCFEDDPYPSAKKCAKCHYSHYREWSVSPHAYAQLSPVFNAMSNTFIKLTHGTTGDFCIRCHTPVGMALHEPINMSQMDRSPTAREGVTCVVCHRINEPWGRITARQFIQPGNLQSPIYGPRGNATLESVLADPDRYGSLRTGPEKPRSRARPIHRQVVPFFYQTTAKLCGGCHDVFAPNGFRLEDAFSEFKSGRAVRCKGEQCQDCHMSKIPGIASGFRFEPAAHVGNVYTPPRQRSNHMFVGPDYSIIHPGLYPHNNRAIREEACRGGNPEQGLATMREWLQFPPYSPWGTRDFEAHVPKDMVFPEAWKDSQRRIEARQILDEQFKLLAEATGARLQLLRNGYGLSEIEVERCDRRHGLKFKVKLYNKTDGHGVPTGFDGERAVFLRVTVHDADGHCVFTSGDLDPNGDYRDQHSVYVHDGILPLDEQLFDLQSKFITTLLRGGERDQILAVPYNIDPVPFVRPLSRPFTVQGHPLALRKQKTNLAANCGHAWAKYDVKASKLSGPGPYTIDIQLVAGMVPVSLVNEVQSVGFDYGMSPRQIAMGIVAGHLVLEHRQSVVNPR